MRGDLPAAPAAVSSALVSVVPCTVVVAPVCAVSVAAKRTILSSVVRRVEICVQKVVRVVPVWAPADEVPGAEPTAR
ncbi:hypothetical protein [Streptomyces subrutilus]|uniref:hypothetical protein n=1 Tax=Streptomyces subrutilus TaxID=36818 RepID=UPI00123DEAE7|nr:hypothetical protein [Streptomyces subrutilus]WSJ32873.1 hypothetical protein OG479_28245 [Streptomyces subrutilus]